MAVSSGFEFKRNEHLFAEFRDALQKNILAINKVDIHEGFKEFLKKPAVEEQPRLSEIRVEDFYQGEYLSEREYKPQINRTQYERSVNIRMNDLFLKSGGQVPNKFSHVTVVGGAGFGKTTFLKRIARDGTLGNISQIRIENAIIHMIRCHNFSKDGKISVPDFLFSDMLHKPSDEASKFGFDYILQNSGNLYFVLDSLDTLPYELDNESEKITPNDTAHPATILYNILIGELFPKACIISSSREYKIKNYQEPLRADRIISLGGLAEESIKNLVFGFLDQKQAVKIWNVLKNQCPDLMALCEIPACLIFTLIGLDEDESVNSFVPTTMSGVIVKVIGALIRSEHAQAFGKHDEHYVVEAINKMKKLSFNGMMRGKVLFTQRDLEEVDLTIDEITDLAIIVPGKAAQHQQILGGTHVFEFCHQILEEMFAALFILNMSLEDFSLFVDNHLQDKDNMIVVRRMLCGILLNEKVYEEVTSHLNYETDNLEEKKRILIASMKMQFAKNKQLEIIRTIHESGESAQYIVPNNLDLIDLTVMPLLQADMFAVASSIFYCDRVKVLKFWGCNITAESVRMFYYRLQNSTVRIEFLNFGGNTSLGPDGLLVVGQIVNKHGTKTLTLRHCGLVAGILEKLDKGLGEAEIDILDVGDNDQLGKEGMTILGKIASKHQIKCLGIHRCELTAEDGIAFRNAIKDYKIQKLNNTQRFSEDKQLEAICEILPVVSRKVLMTGYAKELDKNEKKLLQSKLNEILSDTLEVWIDDGMFGEKIMKAQKDGNSEQGVHSNSEDVETRQKSSQVIESAVYDIPPSGRVIEIGGCEVDFPPGAVQEDSKIPISIHIINNQKWPIQYIGISPALKVEYESEFLVPVKVKFESWCINTGSNNPVACIMRLLPDGSWEEIKSCPLDERRVIQFQNTRFSLVMAFLNRCYYKYVSFPVVGSVFASGRRIFIGIHFDSDNLLRATHTILDGIGGQYKIYINTIYMKYDDKARFELVPPQPEIGDIFDPRFKVVEGRRLVENGKIIFSFKIPIRDNIFPLRNVTLNIFINDELLEDDQYDFDYESDNSAGAQLASKGKHFYGDIGQVMVLANNENVVLEENPNARIPGHPANDDGV